MTFTNEMATEIKLLQQFSLDSSRGIKVHAQQAPKDLIEAAARLHEKGLTDQIDGGYLTERGIEAAGHAKILIGLLSC